MVGTTAIMETVTLPLVHTTLTFASTREGVIVIGAAAGKGTDGGVLLLALE